MVEFLITYAVVTALYLGIDALWLGLVATSFYKKALGNLMLEKPKIGIAALFYLIYAAALAVLVVLPALDSGSAEKALGFGALFGFAAYGTYDVTNLATLKNWPVKMSLVDWAWGSTLSGFVALSAYLVLSQLFGF
ncbi:MAG: DUF2177 family protein [Rhizobiales bacterium]|nr:DUF2177 family protein [Hyphomicrobiales bacterium]